MRIARSRGIQEDPTEGGIPGNAAEQQLDISLNWTVLNQCLELERDEREVRQNLLPSPQGAPAWTRSPPELEGAV